MHSLSAHVHGHHTPWGCLRPRLRFTTGPLPIGILPSHECSGRLSDMGAMVIAHHPAWTYLTYTHVGACKPLQTSMVRSTRPLTQALSLQLLLAAWMDPQAVVPGVCSQDTGVMAAMPAAA